MTVIDTGSVVVYYSTTDPNKGWWVATVPTGEHSFVVRRVLRDGNKAESLEAVEAAATAALPEVEGWKPLGDTVLRGSL